MRLLTYPLLLSCLLTLSNAYGQATRVMRYKDYRGRLYTRQQVDSLIAQLNERGKAHGQGAYADIRDRRRQGDTMVYTFSTMSTSLAMVEAHNKLMQFVGQPLPAFKLRDLDGHLVKSESLRGQPLVLNMWFTTCKGCIDEMPALNTVQADPLNRNIQFLALTYETPAAVQDFLQKRTFHFRQLPAAKAYCDLFTQAYPLTIFVDKQGAVRDIQGPLPLLGVGVHGAKEVPGGLSGGTLDASALYSALDEIR